MFGFLESPALQQLTPQSVVLRIALAIVFSGVLGFERTRKRHAAGFRTYILVCIGATVVMMTGQYVFERFANVDPTRLGAQVISGIGFLGAGTILVIGAGHIKGLTTAAGLWSAACMGIALGIGFYFGAFVMCIAMLLVMTFFDWVQSRFTSRSKTVRLYVRFASLQSLVDFTHAVKQYDAKLDDLETMHEKGETMAALFLLRFKHKKTPADVLELLSGIDGILSYEEM